MKTNPPIVLFMALLSVACGKSVVNNNSIQQVEGRQQVSELLVTIPGEGIKGTSDDMRVIRQRTMTLNMEALTAISKSAQRGALDEPESRRTFSLELFDDARFTAVVDYFESPSEGTSGWSGHLQNAEGVFTIVLDESRILGNVTVLARGIFDIVTIADKIVVRELDANKFKRQQTTDNFKQTVAGPAPRITGPPDDGLTIDMLVGYTPTARDQAAAAAGQPAGSSREIELIINKSIVDTNAACTRSGITTRLNLVFKGPVNYTGDQGGNGSLPAILIDLTGKGDGKLDEVHSDRESDRADIVVLFVADNDESGQANGMDDTNNNEAFEKLAFAVVAWDDARNTPVFGHEVGHIQGCDHNRENPPVRGVYHYSYGYRYSCAGKHYYTMMAERQNIPYQSIPYFSNPTINGPGGCPTGVPENQPNACNEAKTINNTSTLVANFRRSHP